MQGKLSEIDSRLSKTENVTDIALRQLEEQEACDIKLIENYRKLVNDIKCEEDKVIEQLVSEITISKQEMVKPSQSQQKSDISLDKASGSTWV